MRIYRANDIKKAVNDLFSDICCNIDDAAADRLKEAEKDESASLSRFALSVMNESIRIAKEEHCPACQDTGMAVVFIELGQDAHVTGGGIEEAVNEGVREAYRIPFRKSVIDPVSRKNTGDNTPAVIHYTITSGDGLKIKAMAKGFGSENMGRLFMLTPADGIAGVKRAVIAAVKDSGSCACPPVIVGVGIGGTMEKAAIMSKHALFREIGSANTDSVLDNLEKELKMSLDELKIGAGGFGGDTTALAVFIERFPTHIAALPVAVNIQCHISRHGEVSLKGEEAKA